MRQGKDAAGKLPVKWMALESMMDLIFSEKTDVVRLITNVTSDQALCGVLCVPSMHDRWRATRFTLLHWLRCAAYYTPSYILRCPVTEISSYADSSYTTKSISARRNLAMTLYDS